MNLLQLSVLADEIKNVGSQVVFFFVFFKRFSTRSWEVKVMLYCTFLCL